MLFVMVTIKIIMNSIDEQYSSTALGIAAMVKSIGSIVFQGLTGFWWTPRGLWA